MKKHFLVFLTLLLSFIIAYLIISRSGQDFTNPKTMKGINVVLITLDTIRADRLGCYGFSDIKTPTIDSFAAKGIMFKECVSPTPLTLPAHTSILSGTLPLYHGVRDNVGFLVPSELTTITKVFKKNGYQTAAFVAAYVLDSKWGLSNGFDYYFDRFDLGLYKSQSIADIQRPANEVMDQVLGWFRKKDSSKFFIWIHLYDPHIPYEPPAPYKEKYSDNPYLGEIAFADNQMGRLADYLEKSGLAKNTIIIFTGDHGESLGQHAEQTHGFFVYQETLHVPLIFVSPLKYLQSIKQDTIVSSIDIAPTILEMVGLEIPIEVQGQSLVPLFSKNKQKSNIVSYSETYYPRFHFGWSELRSIQDARYKIIVSPKPELYDLMKDPDELNDLSETNQTLLKIYFDKFNNLVNDFSKGAFITKQSKIDNETREILASLGYIGTEGFSHISKNEKHILSTPREKIVLFNQIGKAWEIGSQGEIKEAVSILENVLAEEPEIMSAYIMLGDLYFSESKYDEATKYYRMALEKWPDDTTSVISLANSYMKTNEFREAEKVLNDFLINAHPDSIDSTIYFLLGKICWALRRYNESRNYYFECLRQNPNSASAHKELAIIYTIQGVLSKAEEHIQKCLDLNPILSDAHFALAQIMEKKGNKQAAIQAYMKELEISQNHFSACYNLTVLFRELGQESEEKQYLEKAIKINPKFPLTYFYLAQVYLKRQGNYEEAIQLVIKALELKPERKYEAGCYLLLADLYSRLGDQSRALEYAQKGQEILKGK